MTNSIDAIDNILNRISRGDADAMASLYHTMARPLFAYAKRMGLASQDADDIVQTAFSRVWHYRKSYKGSQGQAWVYQITRNCLLDLQNSNKSFASTQSTERSEYGPEQTLQGMQSQQRLLRALESLPALTREAIVLSRFSGLTNTEIAQLLSLTEGNIKVRIHRGLAILKEALRDD